MYALDSYFFAYFHDLPGALEQIRDAVRSARLSHDSGISHSVLDTTAGLGTKASDIPHDSGMPRPSSSTFRLGSLLRQFHASSTVTPSQPTEEEFTHISRRPNSSSFVPFTVSPEGTPASEEVPTTLHAQDSPGRDTQGSEHTYPPSTSLSSLSSDPRPLHSESAWSMSVPSWLKGGRKFSAGNTNSGVKEMYSPSEPDPSPRSGASDLTADMAFSVLETPEMTTDPEIQDKFRVAFAYDEKETLLGCQIFCAAVCVLAHLPLDFPGFIFRLLPLPGKLFISTNFFCFKSTGPLTARIKVSINRETFLNPSETFGRWPFPYAKS